MDLIRITLELDMIGSGKDLEFKWEEFWIIVERRLERRLEGKFLGSGYRSVLGRYENIFLY